MTPAQTRMARAALYWSVEQLAEAAGVHRNTISNFETGKYAGDPQTRAAIKRALESAGVVFTEENGEVTEVKLRRHREGDLVRFRAQARMRSDYGISADEVGTVVQVEPHPPQTGPTYRISVQFPSYPRALPFVFWPEYLLVKAAPDTAGFQSPKCQDEMMMSDPTVGAPHMAASPPTNRPTPVIIEEFCQECRRIHAYWQMLKYLFNENPGVDALKEPHYEHFFAVIKSSLYESFVQGVVRLHDPGFQLGQPNLTVNYLIEHIQWDAATKARLIELREQMLPFVAKLKPPRNKFTAHNDLNTILQRPPLGGFDAQEDDVYFDNLQEFTSIVLDDRFLFGDFVRNDVEFFMMAFDQGRIKRN